MSVKLVGKGYLKEKKNHNFFFLVKLGNAKFRATIDQTSGISSTIWQIGSFN